MSESLTLTQWLRMWGMGHTLQIMTSAATFSSIVMIIVSTLA